jgi:hypothetical protein
VTPGRCTQLLAGGCGEPDKRREAKGYLIRV